MSTPPESIQAETALLSAILEAMQSFRAGQARFYDTVDVIYASYANLTLVPEAWSSKFFELWTDLELELAFANNSTDRPFPSAADLDSLLAPLERLARLQIEQLRGR